MGWSKCLVCATHFEDDTGFKNNGDNNIVKVFDKIFQIFSKYFPVTLAEKETDSFNFEHDIFPFCDPCKEDVAKLCRSHNELESVQEKVLKIIARITQKVIESSQNNFKDFISKGNARSNRSLETVNGKKLQKLDTTISLFHSRMRHHYTPSVILRDCQNFVKISRNNPANSVPPQYELGHQELRENFGTNSSPQFSICTITIDEDEHNDAMDRNDDYGSPNDEVNCDNSPAAAETCTDQQVEEPVMVTEDLDKHGAEKMSKNSTNKSLSASQSLATDDLSSKTKNTRTKLVERGDQTKFVHKKRWTSSLNAEKGLYTCETCGGSFSTLSSVHCHVTKDHEGWYKSKNPVMSSACGHFVYFNRPFHKISSASFKCSSCDFQSSFFPPMKDHLMTCKKADKDNLRCTFCPTYVTTIGPLSVLKKHYRLFHPDQQINSMIVDCGQQIWLCDGRWLFKKVEEMDKGKLFVCLICGHRLPEEEGIEKLREHTLQHPENEYYGPKSVHGKRIDNTSTGAVSRGLNLMDRIRTRILDSSIVNVEGSGDKEDVNQNDEASAEQSPSACDLFRQAKEPLGGQELVLIGTALFAVYFGDSNVYTCQACSAMFLKPGCAKIHGQHCEEGATPNWNENSIKTVLVVEAAGEIKFVYKKRWPVFQVDKDVFTCHECRGVFQSFQSMKRHITISHEGWSTCTNSMVAAEGGHILYLGKPFRKLSQPSSGYKCSACDLLCPSFSAAKQHVILCDKADTNKLHCTLCDEGTVIGPPAFLKMHYAAKHPQVEINSSLVDCGNYTWLCDGCWLFKRFVEKEEEEVGQDTEVRENFLCLICGQQVVGGLEAVRAHVLQHPDPDNQNTAIPPCADCGQQFSDLASLQSHFQNRFVACGRFVLKAGIKDLCCTICDEPIGPVCKLSKHYATKHPDIDLKSQITDCGHGNWLCDGLWLFKEVFMNDDDEEEEGHRKILTCTLCHVRIDNGEKGPDAMRAHAKQHPKYICETCGRSFRRSGDLKLHHQATHFQTLVPPPGGHPSGDEGASGKKEKFVYNAVKNLYYERNDDDDGLKCCSCDFLAVDHQTMRRHIQFAHTKRGIPNRNLRYPTKITSVDNQDPEGTKLKSARQSFSVMSSDGLFLYNAKWPYMQTDNGQWRCATCQQTKRRRVDINRHIRFLHEELAIDWICKTCGKRFADSQKLGIHEGTHSVTLSFKCPKCDASFKSKERLHSHKYLLHKGKRFTCDKCSKIFKNSAALKVHRSVHSDAQNWLCAECPKTFKRSTSLRRHKKAVHGSEKPFACPECPMRFTQSQNVQRHVNVVHSEARKAQGHQPKVRKDRSRTGGGRKRKKIEDDDETEEEDESVAPTTEEESEDD